MVPHFAPRLPARSFSMENSLLRSFQFRHLDAFQERWDEIHRYNTEVEARLPLGAKEFALAEWHYNANDPRCPHDSWIRLIEIKPYDPKAEARSARIELLGAYHDRMISFDYLDVRDFSIEGQIMPASRQEADWLYDEVHLCDSGTVEHVIEFQLSVIRVECADLRCSFALSQIPAKTRRQV
jgi:hypothetical protein